MTSEQIKVTGNFLATYKTDLNHILGFQNWKAQPDYSPHHINSFYSFLKEFRVIRNIERGSANKLLEETYEWIHSSHADNVDLFANHLSAKGLTRNKFMKSMASKILFLNNPWEILPMDSLARKTLNLKENNYLQYWLKLKEYITNYNSDIELISNSVDIFTLIIEAEYHTKIENLEIIRRNRIIDKLLWTSGK